MVGRPFPKGLSGNPGGKPVSRDFSQLARRYAPDIVKALIDVLRLPARDFAAAKVAAARELRIIGWPGLEKQGLLDGVANPGQLHLLAVQSVHAVLPNPHLTGEPTEEGPEIDGEGWISAPDLLPTPLDDIPTEALPLWDAYKARKRAEAPESDPETALERPEAPDSGEFPTIQAGFTGFFDENPENGDADENTQRGGFNDGQDDAG